MENDWRLFRQERFLQGKHLVKAAFLPTEHCDHAHCIFCWEKFGSGDNMLHEGYHTLEIPGQPWKQWWICEQCYQDFKDRFQWIVDNE